MATNITTETIFNFFIGRFPGYYTTTERLAPVRIYMRKKQFVMDKPRARIYNIIS